MAPKKGIPFSAQVDPCPVCGIAQEAHWKCRRCTARGHATGRAASDPTLCAWCEIEVIGAAKGIEALVERELMVNARTK